MFLKYNKSTIFFFLLIFIACFLPGNNLPKTTISNLDKLVHFVMFFGLAMSMFIGFVKQNQYPALHYRAVRYTLIFCYSYSMFTELVQHFFIPNRTFEFLDFLADSAGVTMALGLFLIVTRGEKCGVR